jgi:hypothetical protein
MNGIDELARRLAVVLRRYARQNGIEAAGGAEAEIARVAGRLGELVARRGLPRPLGPGETGTPGGMSDAETAPLVAEVLGGVAAPWLADAARQLVKACFYPEFTECRESWCEPAKDGGCRRQDLARVRLRVSGTHCVDCPYWTAPEPAAHAAKVAAAWQAGAEAFAAGRDVFLPEDFRAVRQWLRAAARGEPV